MRHRLGTLILVVGVGLLAWSATVYLWKDPFTMAYTAYEQRRLETKLDDQFESWQAAPKPPRPNGGGKAWPDFRERPRSAGLGSHEGDAIARLEIPRLALDAVV